MPIILYGSDTCHYCREARNFLDKNKISFIEKNVDQDESYIEEIIELTGQNGVPVLVVEKNDEEGVVVGYNEEAFTKLLLS